MPNPDSTDNPEFKIVLAQIRDGLKADPKKWHKVAEKLRGISEVSPGDPLSPLKE